MKILTLNLENFRGIKELTINFDGKDTDIYGANGTGKTTIANAVSWLLFGKAATGEKDFDPKTTGAHGLHHTAQAVFQKDNGAIISLKKDFYEVWSKKKGSPEKTFSGNTTDYWIDEIPHKESAYNKTIQSLCGGTLEAAKVLTMYDYFPEVMSADDRRKMLFDVCGDKTDEDVISSNPALKDLDAYLTIPGTVDQKYSTDEYRKIATERRKKINEELKMLPARIDEVTKSVPESLPDESAVKSRIADLSQQMAAVEDAIRDIKDGDTNGIALKKEIIKKQNELEEERLAFNKTISEDYDAKYNNLNQMKAECRELSNSQRTIEDQISTGKNRIDVLTQKREQLLAEFESVQRQQWDKGKETCPTCGQSLPPNKVQSLREDFNLTKSRKKEDINNRGQECSQSVISGIQEKLVYLEDSLHDVKTKHDEASKNIEDLEKVIANKPIFEETSQYKRISDQIAQLKNSAVESGSDQDELILAKNKEKESIQHLIQSENSALADIAAAERAKARITELQQDQRKSAADLEHIEKGLYLCDQFTRTKADMITNNINSKFNFVRFKLFDELINGGLKECCEPTVQNAQGMWVDYRSANTASQVNAGMDIISVLSDFYNIHLPVFIDRAESVTHINHDGIQLIRLIVSDADKTLRIEN
ncbi:AAA family ATPase [Megasphaera sueciensis]|uniref:AAA family ATPase n=1 Tax=Megasphaera sueciensis TaxID=349094 RepID=UPI003D04D537